MHSFYIDSPAGGAAMLPPEEARHALKVLRLGPGDAVCAMDGAGRRWRGEIGDIDGGSVRVNLLEALPDNEAPVRLTVYEGLPKADKLDFIAQKLTELGAAALAPVRMARCVVKLDGRDGEKRRERLERIAREAAKQCGRGMPLQVNAPMDWRIALRAMAAHDLLLIPWEEAGGTRRTCSPPGKTPGTSASSSARRGASPPKKSKTWSPPGGAASPSAPAYCARRPPRWCPPRWPCSCGETCEA